MDRETQCRLNAESDDQLVSGNDLSSKDYSANVDKCPTAKNTGIPPPLYDGESDNVSDITKPEPCACVRTPVPSYDHIYAQEAKPAAKQEKSAFLPSYSTVMKHPPKNESCVDRFHTPPAPPTYNDVPGVYVVASSRQLDRVYAIPSLPETAWRSHSQPAYCPRCEVLILTLTRTRKSLATHLAALVLCLFGCWPCCLLPYCLNICKNTYHLCPICKRYLGVYIPW